LGQICGFGQLLPPSVVLMHIAFAIFESLLFFFIETPHQTLTFRLKLIHAIVWFGEPTQGI